MRAYARGAYLQKGFLGGGLFEDIRYIVLRSDLLLRGMQFQFVRKGKSMTDNWNTRITRFSRKKQTLQVSDRLFLNFRQIEP